MSTIETSMSTEQLEHLLSEAIGYVGEARAFADMTDPERLTPAHDRALMAQAGLISLLDGLGDGRPAPKLAQVHQARVEAAMAPESAR